MADTPNWNAFQKAAFAAYAKSVFGESVGAADPNAFSPDTAALASDDVIRGVLAELSDAEDCETQDDAVNRLRNLQADIEKMIDAVEALPA